MRAWGSIALQVGTVAVILCVCVCVCVCERESEFLTIILDLVRFLATTSSDKTTKIWNVDDGFTLDKTLIGHQRWVWDCAFSADSAYLVTGTCSSWCILSFECVAADNIACICVCRPPQHHRTRPRGYGICPPVRPSWNMLDTARPSPASP
jgi:WD40 repeat protein